MFKRYTGISWLMVEQLKKHVTTKGRRPKLSMEDQVLLCLSYWRVLFLRATEHLKSQQEGRMID